MLKNFLKNKGKELVESFKAPKGQETPEQRSDFNSYAPAQPTVDQKVTPNLIFLFSITPSFFNNSPH